MKKDEVKLNGEVPSKNDSKTEEKSTGAFGLGVPSPKPNTTGIIASSKPDEKPNETVVTSSVSAALATSAKPPARYFCELLFYLIQYTIDFNLGKAKFIVPLWVCPFFKDSKTLKVILNPY